MGWKAAQKLIHHWKILRGDNVLIIRGKDKGDTGIIKRVIRTQNRVIVEGKNLVKKHIKQGQGHEGGIFTVEAPLHVSNVQVLDPVTGKPCKVGYRYLEDGTKVRVSRGIGASGSIIPRPEILKIRTTPRPTLVPRTLHWIWSRKRHTTLKLEWECQIFRSPFFFFFVGGELQSPCTC
ncbi:50S ribosomal L24 [Olea europaea subsp. europaea]|uniref:50S ribosomal L24 n=1 Tax=Olea europaea subsp. europaea TaxID=158383 RepID=A0A8S0Q303_OLEEU|nr:50S ribosomal L24 [Olea europaea subsp. europaea]